LNEQGKTLIHNHDDDDDGDDDDCDDALWQKIATVKLAFISLKKSTHKGFVTISQASLQSRRFRYSLAFEVVSLHTHII
jgi:hypothetical protein